LLGQPIIFDYKTGAGGLIAAEAMARAPADGYYFTFMDMAIFAYMPHMRKVSYDPLKSFTPIANMGQSPYAFVAAKDRPFRNMNELVTYAKANPNKLSCGSGGVGTPHQLIAELFKLRTGISMKHVPYQGGTASLIELSGGHVDLVVAPVSSLVPYLQGDRVRALGVTSAKRATALPEVPTVQEQGFSDFDASPWTIFAVPTRVPEEPREVLRGAIEKTFEDRELVALLAQRGAENVGGMTIADLTKRIQVDYEKWGEVIRKAGIKI
jgi:tripartite-type tricarboxylate transporter receptor subunit TctC